MRQVNLRRLLAYVVVSHANILVLGLFSLQLGALQGSVVLSATFGLALSALALMTGLLFMRTNTSLLPKLGNLFHPLPLLGVTFLVAALSVVGMPATPGFDAVCLVLKSAIASFGTLVTIAAALGNVVAAGFLLWAFQRAFLAPLPEGVPALPVTPASAAELAVAGSLTAVLLGVGFYSEPWLQLIHQPLAALSGLFQP
jgi:NADH-quinone oxidoreductase subunit M